MPRKYTPITCSKSDLISLQSLAMDPLNPRLALRARMILQCLEGKQIKEIAMELGERPNTVILWKNRFSDQGIPGLFNLPRGKNANRYGKTFQEKIRQLLNTDPPDGFPRWTGPLLSKYTGVPPDVIWRYLRKEGISLADIRRPPTDIYTNTPNKIICEVPLRLELRKEEPMKNTSENNLNDNPGNDRMDLEIVARIKGKDGTMIEKTVRIDDAIPNVCDFDLSTKDGFLKDLDELEQAVLSARNQMAEGLAENYLGTASKKNRSLKK